MKLDLTRVLKRFRPIASCVMLRKISSTFYFAHLLVPIEKIWSSRSSKEYAFQETKRRSYKNNLRIRTATNWLTEFQLNFETERKPHGWKRLQRHERQFCHHLLQNVGIQHCIFIFHIISSKSYFQICNWLNFHFIFIIFQLCNDFALEEFWDRIDISWCQAMLCSL